MDNTNWDRRGPVGEIKVILEKKGLRRIQRGRNWSGPERMSGAQLDLGEVSWPVSPRPPPLPPHRDFGVCSTEKMDLRIRRNGLHFLHSPGLTVGTPLSLDFLTVGTGQGRPALPSSQGCWKAYVAMSPVKMP